MKRKITLFLALCCLVLSLASCKEEDHSTEAKQTAESFLEEVKNGNFTKASSYCSPKEAKSLGWESYSEEAADDFASSISGEGSVNTDYKPSDAVTSIISSWIDQLCAEMITGYKVSDKITREKQVYTVPADISYHDSSTLSEEVTKTTEEYLGSDISKIISQEQLAKLTQIYMTEGQNAMLDALFEQILPDLLDSIAQSYKNAPTIDDTITLTVENVDGDWLITGDDGKLAAITSLSPSAESSEKSFAATEAGRKTLPASTEAQSK